MEAGNVETPVARVSVTPAAAALLHRLQALHGPLVFHQSGGCCDGSTPMCYPRREFRIGSRDVFLGVIADTPFYIGSEQFEYWKHTHLCIDVVPGRGAGFSVETPEGMRFLTRSRLYSDEEWATLQGQGEPARGEQPVP
ncbi:MAG: DUF779 domain-containing protein [Gemmatimonadaceae bacterium]|nr:DUF779 domain-containing protein [Gemmatimonadaceae bacterium]